MTSPRPLLLALLLLVACGRPGKESAYPGTIELDESDVAPLLGGRIVEMRIQEGDSVTPGYTIASLTQASLPATVEERWARLAAARARLADLERGSRVPELARAEADLAAAEADADRTAKDLVRVGPLAQNGVV
ncbi:MAG TPA: hypothetical protein VG692_02600, partial [Gemmatimonadales bacterium]|nr:hypothetical protein [Gemmatimonadales bacterium]